MFTSKYPIVKGLFPYIAGVFFASVYQLSSLNHLIIIFLLLFFGVILYILLCKYFTFLLPISSIVFGFLFLIVGFLFTNLENSSVANFYAKKNVSFSGKMTASIVAEPVKKKKSVQVTAKIVLMDNPAIQPLVLLYLENDSISRSLHRGDRLLIHAHLHPPDPPKNPYAFDYRKYLNRKGISFTAYVDSHSWMLLKQNPRPSPLVAIAALQSRFSELFAANGLSGPEYSVITAILLGNGDTMDSDLKSSYAAAGVSHILCVSGMHVGIIFMILNFLLKPLDFSRRLRFVKSLLLIVSVWFYAVLTGLAPSVQRSATMFTFVTIGGLLRRKVDVFHSLFASMFVLLIAKPLLIFEIGFEMSYLAVFGIVIFQPRLASLLHPKTRVGRYFWELTCVSIAAQLATFPLSIYYFGQFPNYFLLSNLSVMSLSFAVIVTGVALLAVSWWPFAACAIGWLLTHEIRLMNRIITFINNLPYSVTDQLSFSLFQTMLIYSIITLLFIFLVKRIKLLKYCSLSLIILLFSTFAYAKYKSLSCREITFYSVNNKTVVGVNQQGAGWLLLDSAALVSTDWYDFNVKNHERHQGIRSQMISLDHNLDGEGACLKNHFLCFDGKLIYFLSKQVPLYPESSPITLDYLYVQDNAKIQLSRVLQTFEIKEVVIGTKVTPFYQKRWEDACATRNIPVHSLRENGYLTVKSDI